jgi:DnaJ-class molecular chaperone
MLARLTEGPEAGAYVFVQPWPGLPELVTRSNEVCTKCAVKCPQCKGKGTQHCTSVRCGGSGKIVTSWEKCPQCKGAGEVTDAAGKSFPVLCPKCKGAGRVPAEEFTCQACEGTGKQTCTACQGTKRKPTGKADKDPEGNPNGPACPACQGGRYAFTSAKQAWKTFAVGITEGYTMLGPMRGMALRMLPGSDTPKDLTAEADFDGAFPMLALEKPDTVGSRMYLYAGKFIEVQ